jgi:hypothetical protein
MENSIELMEFHGIQWNSIEFSIEFHEFSMEFNGIPWNPMECHGTEVDGIHGIQWNSMENSTEFH